MRRTGIALFERGEAHDGPTPRSACEPRSVAEDCACAVASLAVLLQEGSEKLLLARGQPTGVDLCRRDGALVLVGVSHCATSLDKSNGWSWTDC